LIPHMEKLDSENREMLQSIIDDQDKYFSFFQKILESGKIQTWKTRIHGNYKLDKLLFTGKDFIVTDFEGEVEYPLSVRKLKHCPLKDVAAMLGSLHYAVNIGYFRRKEFVPVNGNYLRPLKDQWFDKVSDTFLKGYLEETAKYGFLPSDKDQIDNILSLFMFEKAIREMHNFIVNEPESILIPIKTLQNLKKKIKNVCK
jgi:maltose alpha-D-glucosyltransferase / alpha-amylase